MTQASFGALVGVSQQAISSLVNREVLDMSATGQQVLLAYCSHLREHAAGRASGGDLDLATERAGLAKEQKDRLAMVNAVTRKELAPVALIEEVLSKAGARIAGMFDAIPGAVRRRVPSLSSDEVNNIAKEIARIRNIAAAMSLADLREETEEGEQEESYLEDEQP